MPGVDDGTFVPCSGSFPSAVPRSHAAAGPFLVGMHVATSSSSRGEIAAGLNIYF